MRGLITNSVTALLISLGLSGTALADGWRDTNRQPETPPAESQHNPGWNEPQRDDHRRPNWSDPSHDRSHRDGHRSGYVDNFSTFVPLQLRRGQPANVDQVYLNVGGRVLAASARKGVIRNDQNRLDWSGLPGVGRLAEHRYRQRDFDASHLIGEAYFEQGVVWLDLSEEQRRSRFGQIVFLNQDFAYRLSANPEPDRSIRIPKRPPGHQIGQIFRDSNGDLLVLVRPFIVTESHF